MKKIAIFLTILLALQGFVACSTTDVPEAVDESSPSSSATSEEEDVPQEESVPQEAPEGVEYQNIPFDFSEDIAAYNAKNAAYTTPEKLDLPISVKDEHDATGVQLVASSDEANQTDYYLNAMVAGNALVFSGEIASASSQVGDGEERALEVKDGTVTATPAVIQAADPVDEVIAIETTDGKQYNIHTLNEYICGMDIETNGDVEAGVYTFAIDRVLLRLDTDGNLVYYRNVRCRNYQLVENFKAQDTQDGRFYSYFLELDTDRRNMHGGFSSGIYVVMDSNYNEIDYVSLLPNDDPNHTHGEGYLDQHEFVMLAQNHWISLSYTPLKVSNLSGKGIDGGDEGFVHAGIIQEVKDGAVLLEINTTDYDFLYETATECNDYANSTDQTVVDDIQDYVHLNSVAVDPKDNHLIVSMRHQYAVYKFDRETGEVLWILGGKANEFSGLDEVLDSDGNLFVGQHDAKYVDAAVAGNDSTITVFDNHTSFQENLSRTVELVLDETAKTATATLVQGADLDAKNGKNHWATHCACVEHHSDASIMIGWGLHGALDNNPEAAPTHPVFTDYNPGTDTIAFELCVTRSPLIPNDKGEACFSYRSYKNAD